MSKIDVHLGRQVCKKLGLDFQAHDIEHPHYVAPKRFERKLADKTFRLASGFSSRPRPPATMGITNLLPANCVVLRGGVLDLIRAVWWRGWPVRRRLIDKGIDSELVNAFIGQQDLAMSEPRFREIYKSWRATLPEDADQRIHDWIFVELFYPGSWQGYYEETETFYMCPSADREIISLLTSLDVEARFHLGTFNDMMSAVAPELADMPTHFEYRKNPSRWDKDSEAA